MPTVAMRLIEKGKLEGLLEGEKKGEQRGQLKRSQEVLIKQIQLKYGITESEKDFIRKVTDLDKLDIAIEKILTNITKEELLALLK
jgi:hypothetical protein